MASELFLTSDMHFNHARILDFCGDSRPFDTIQEMNEGLVESWNSVVGVDDEVWVLGDAVMGQREPTLMEYIPKLNGTKVLVPGNHDYCVTEDTKALTRDGFKSYNELRIGDKVLSCYDDGSTKWEPIRRVVSYHYNGPMISYVGRGFDGMVTPEHRIVLRKTLKNGEASNNWKEYVGGDLLSPFKKGYIQTSTDNKQSEFDINDDMIRLLAWCLTDGSYRNDVWVIYQRESNAHKIRNILVGLNLSFKESIRSRDPISIADKTIKRKPENEVSFYIHKKASTTLPFEGKSLPKWVNNLSARQFEIFWDTMVDGDGSYRSAQLPEDETNSGVLYCNLSSLRDELRVALAINGYSSSVSVFNNSDFRLNFTRRSYRMLNKKIQISSVDYDGIVWCVSVDSGRFFVERNGKIHLTGNCHPMHGGKALKWAEIYTNAGLLINTTQVRDHIAGKDVLFCHFPLTTDEYDDRDFDKWRPTDAFDVLLHGHVHQAWKVNGKQVNVGVDVWGLKPVHIEEALAAATL